MIKRGRARTEPAVAPNLPTRDSDHNKPQLTERAGVCVMFSRSKAAELPPCPQRPSWEDMEEDLKNSKKSDVIFNLAKTTLASSRGSQEEQRPNMSDSETAETAGKDASEEEMFQLAVEFVERNDCLVASTERLAEESERLREVSESLRETVEEVKKQALVAIDGC